MSTPDKIAARALWASIDPALVGRWAGTRARRREQHGRLMEALAGLSLSAESEDAGTPPTPVPATVAVVRASIPTPITSARREPRERSYTPLQELYAGPESPQGGGAAHRERAFVGEFPFGVRTSGTMIEGK